MDGVVVFFAPYLCWSRVHNRIATCVHVSQSTRMDDARSSFSFQWEPVSVFFSFYINCFQSYVAAGRQRKSSAHENRERERILGNKSSSGSSSRQAIPTSLGIDKTQKIDKLTSWPTLVDLSSYFLSRPVQSNHTESAARGANRLVPIFVGLSLLSFYIYEPQGTLSDPRRRYTVAQLCLAISLRVTKRKRQYRRLK